MIFPIVAKLVSFPLFGTIFFTRVKNRAKEYGAALVTTIHSVQLHVCIGYFILALNSCSRLVTFIGR